MDSWTPQQLAIMKAGGNAACAKFLEEKGVPKSLSIKAKYESPAAQLYKEVLKARVSGLPEPTSLPQPRLSAGSSAQYNSSNTTSNNKSMAFKAKPGEDPNGMERLTGESDEQYVARQTRIREEAKARMAAKFGGSGGMSGRMGGVGSNTTQGFGSNNSSYGGGGGGLVDVDSFKNSLVSGFGSVFSSVSSLTVQASQQASAVLSDTARTTTVSTMWSSFTSVASRAAAAMTEPDDAHADDGLAALQRKIKEEKQSRTSNQPEDNRYSGFGSEDAFNQGGFSSLNRGVERSNSSFDTTSVTSSMKTLGFTSSSSSLGSSASLAASAPNSLNSIGTSSRIPTNVTSRPVQSAPGSGPSVISKKLPTGDDFFASFGA